MFLCELRPILGDRKQSFLPPLAARTAVRRIGSAADPVSVYFFRELLRLFAHAATGEEVDLIVGALTLVDLTLVGSLIVMVMLSGYENFVSKLDIGDVQKSWHGLASSMQDHSKLKLRRDNGLLVHPSTYLHERKRGCK
jgi:uncharacterized protein (TIGR00645 family)